MGSVNSHWEARLEDKVGRHLTVVLTRVVGGWRRVPRILARNAVVPPTEKGLQ